MNDKCFGTGDRNITGCECRAIYERLRAAEKSVPRMASTSKIKMTVTTYIKELQDVIRRLHGAEATHVESVPVRESFQGKTVWDGIVEVFDLRGHPTAFRVYAWSHDTDDPDNPRRHVTVLHAHPVKSPQDAVKAAIIQEFKLGTAEET